MRNSYLISAADNYSLSTEFCHENNINVDTVKLFNFVLFCRRRHFKVTVRNGRCRFTWHKFHSNCSFLYNIRMSMWQHRCCSKLLTIKIICSISKKQWMQFICIGSDISRVKLTNHYFSGNLLLKYINSGWEIHDLSLRDWNTVSWFTLGSKMVHTNVYDWKYKVSCT